MYNISPQATGLSENAGVAGSKFGDQIFNDFFVAAEYDGPCPPANVQPFAPSLCFYGLRARCGPPLALASEFSGQR
jgi:phosphatidylethanolamine-binding protein (PEBP) family uncharacterized protein